MMKFRFCMLFSILLLTTQVIYSQAVQWTWVSGDTIENQYPFYGAKGVASPLNKPGSRLYSSSWADSAGHLWLFGGNGYQSGRNTILNDLWRFDIAAGEWTWMGGDSTLTGHVAYGTQGIASSGNQPGFRSGSVSWTDAFGNLWLFGGYGYTDSLHYGNLNDLWQYNPSTNQWTWMKGDSTPDHKGIYGTQGQPSAAGAPGGRTFGMGWTDASGKLWLMGGQGLDASGFPGTLNDLWQYDPSTNQWIWMKGDNAINQTSVYGTKGVSSAANKPGSRQNSVTWTDNSGKLWLFGGNGYAVSGGFLNDLWRYDPSTNQWAWISGDYTTNQPGMYGTQGTPSSSNKPGARSVASGWSDKSGNLWLFGGLIAPFDQYNDLWKYDIAGNQWTWVAGDNTVDMTGIYGIRNTPSPANAPGARYSALSWTDSSGKFWLFGGLGYPATISRGSLNDLWKFSPDNVYPVHLLSFTGSMQRGGIGLRWTVENETNFDRYEIERSLDGRQFSKTGTATANNQKNYTHTDAVTDETRQAAFVYYRLRLVSKDGSIVYSSIIKVPVASVSITFSISPNPATLSVQLHYSAVISGKVEITLTDAAGKTLRKTVVTANSNLITLSRDGFPAGIYFVNAKWNGQEQTKKVMLK